MSINLCESDDGNSLVITLPSEFDFRSHKEFREAHKDPQPDKQYIVDFSQTEHMDSSALGMLLLMREELGNVKSRVKFINCRPNIRSLLEMASFHQLFEVA